MEEEKRLAVSICNMYAKQIVDENCGVTMGGITLGEKYAEKRYKKGDSDVLDINKCQMALRHWVYSVGYETVGFYEKTEVFHIVISNHILNC